MKGLLGRLLGGPSQKALAKAHETAEIARLQAIANEPPPPGNGWRVGDQDSEGKWTVWRGDRKIAAFWDENEAAEWARVMNADPVVNPVLSDSHYCVNCHSRDVAACCPQRVWIAELWRVSDGALADGLWHIWRPDMDLRSLIGTWETQEAAQREADRRNREARRTGADGPLAAFLDVVVPEGQTLAVGPFPSPQNGLWYTFDRKGPHRSYIRKKNAQAAADRANNAR